MLTADTHCCTEKINTILSSNYLTIKHKDKTIEKNKISLIIKKNFFKYIKYYVCFSN